MAMSIAVESDGSLLMGIRSRDPQTLDAVIREYLPQIVRAARAAGLKPQEADDAAQSTFMTFFEKADTFEGRSHLRTWLFGILFRKVMEVRRAGKREYESDDIDAVIERRFDANGSWIRPPQPADAELYAKQVRKGISECLEITPPKQRMAFVLREIEGMETADICRILEVSDTNVGVLLYRVRNRLRECLEAKGVRR